MDALLRLLLRFILVPLGYLAAVIAGSCVILLGSWLATRASPAEGGSRDADDAQPIVAGS